MNNKCTVAYWTVGDSKTLIDFHTSNKRYRYEWYLYEHLSIIVFRKRNVERQELGSIINTIFVIF